MLDKLKNRDYYLLIDKSGSMGDIDCNGKSRWEACQESTQAIANKINEYDPDGITVIPFASTFKTYENTTPSKVKDIFVENSPMGGTHLAPPLKSVFAEYLHAKSAGKTKVNGALCLVVTDGLPQDAGEVAKEICQFTKRLDTREEFGISFLQVGKDIGASRYLKQLDDDLESQGAKLDIVNTKTFEELENIGLTEALIAALTE